METPSRPPCKLLQAVWGWVLRVHALGLHGCIFSNGSARRKSHPTQRGKPIPPSCHTLSHIPAPSCPCTLPSPVQLPCYLQPCQYGTDRFPSHPRTNVSLPVCLQIPPPGCSPPPCFSHRSCPKSAGKQGHRMGSGSWLGSGQGDLLAMTDHPRHCLAMGPFSRLLGQCQGHWDHSPRVPGWFASPL